ncbi:Protein of unknown function (DUF2795) [Candidatus Nitrososphaera evergladensis SR1]|uniref:C2H2-type domain-containing protein n=1 Tax=Candidatus Nitrososphaera evergladensis SR1 TaxID=1459636 RepID=A0A075MN79_9ARCH|nr:DUF2795 domain-containing protein [Candidatus Nitrososphaera evergladensis]AIF82996.1 Protein of unknown function (DUF2795) [Candidatus Nitrososphaera evergladensis SR1]
MAKEDKPEPRTIKTRTGPTEKQNNTTTRFICKVCGDTFDDQDVLRRHVDTMHEQKRTVTATEVIRKAFGGRINFPKTKAEIVKEVEENKESLPLEVVDVVRNMPDRRYNDEADFVRGIKDYTGGSIAE